MPEILHIDPDEFLLDTFKLGRKLYETGFRPKHAISIWRGGTPVGLGVDAFYRSRGLHIEHTTIATDSYQGISQQGEVIVKNLEHLVQVGGVGCAAFGSDLDGIPYTPTGLPDCTGFATVLARLRERGFSGDDLERLCWGNWARALRPTFDG